MSVRTWTALRDKVRAEQNLVIAFGSELRGAGYPEAWPTFAFGLTGAKLICLGDYANSRGAADMGLYPDLLPGYHPVSDAATFRKEWGAIPTEKGLSAPEMMDAAKAGKLKALLRGRLESRRETRRSIHSPLSKSFRRRAGHVPDRNRQPSPMSFCRQRTRTKNPARCTNTCGDLQLVKKAGEVSNTKADFEMIVRIADAMGADVRKLVPFGGGTHADMGQTRGAQSGEADRHAVWLEAHNLEPKMSPFDPIAILDEIQRVVPRLRCIADRSSRRQRPAH